jgi:hypothetical protein
LRTAQAELEEIEQQRAAKLEEALGATDRQACRFA